MVILLLDSHAEIDSITRVCTATFLIGNISSRNLIYVTTSTDPLLYNLLLQCTRLAQVQAIIIIMSSLIANLMTSVSKNKWLGN